MMIEELLNVEKHIQAADDKHGTRNTTFQPSPDENRRPTPLHPNNSLEHSSEGV
jgi:hypothetical protein